MKRNRDESGAAARDTGVPEAELRALFARRRPDPAVFAAGIVTRLETGQVDGSALQSTAETTGAADGDAAAETHGFLERAAAVIPGWPLVVHGKPLSALLSLPALLVAGLIVAFHRGWKAVDPNRSTQFGVPSGPFRGEAGFRRLHAAIEFAGIGVLLWSILFGPSSTTDVVVAILVVVILSATWCVGELGRVGVPDALAVTRGMFQILAATACGLILVLDRQQVVPRNSLLLPGAAGWVLALGLWRVGRWGSRLSGARHSAALVVLGFLALLLLGQPLPTLVEPRLQGALESSELDVEQLRGWKEAGAAAEALRLAGHVPTVGDDLRRQVEAAIEASAERGMELPHSAVLDASVQMGLLGASQLQVLAGTGPISQRLEHLFGPATDRFLLGPDSRYLLDCLLASEPLDAARRELLIERLEASWPELEPNRDVLGSAVLVADWLSRLGRPDLVTARTEWLHELLRSRYVAVGGMFMRPGGFCRFAPTQSSTPDATVDALRLMRIVGAPEGMSMHGVAAFLSGEIPLGVVERMLADGVMPLSAYLMLETAPGIPRRSVWEWFLDERLTLGCLLLVALSLRAIRATHRYQESLVGASP